MSLGSVCCLTNVSFYGNNRCTCLCLWSYVSSEWTMRHAFAASPRGRREGGREEVLAWESDGLQTRRDPRYVWLKTWYQTGLLIGGLHCVTDTCCLKSIHIAQCQQSIQLQSCQWQNTIIKCSCYACYFVPNIPSIRHLWTWFWHSYRQYLIDLRWCPLLSSAMGWKFSFTILRFVPSLSLSLTEPTHPRLIRETQRKDFWGDC